MRRQQVLVRAIKTDGKWGSVDVLDLDEESFRAFVLDKLYSAGLVARMSDEHTGDIVFLREREDE
jgi:hypothetical protein